MTDETMIQPIIDQFMADYKHYQNEIAQLKMKLKAGSQSHR